MFETVTVDEALAKGKRMVTFPSMGVLLGLIAISVVLVLLYPTLGGWVIGSGVLLSFVLAWLYWGVSITKWRVWAFDNVRNVHELKKRAVKEQLIWKDDSFFARTEIWTADDKMKWDNLQDKFKLEDIFHDDLAIPAETTIRYSKNMAIFEMVTGLCVGGSGGYFLMQPNQLLLSGILLVAGIGIFVIGYRHYNNHVAQITLSNDGVATASVPFFSWGDVVNEDTKMVQQGKSRKTYFVYQCPQGNVEINIGELDTGKRKLEKLLRIYRGRYEVKHKLKA